MYQCVSELPQANRDTLAFVTIHLQKVAQALECKMPLANLAKVFGPTIVGHRSSNPTHLEMFEDLKVQPKVSFYSDFQYLILFYYTVNLIGKIRKQAPPTPN